MTNNIVLKTPKRAYHKHGHLNSNVKVSYVPKHSTRSTLSTIKTTFIFIIVAGLILTAIYFGFNFRGYVDQKKYEISRIIVLDEAKKITNTNK